VVQCWRTCIGRASQGPPLADVRGGDVAVDVPVGGTVAEDVVLGAGLDVGVPGDVDVELDGGALVGLRLSRGVLVSTGDGDDAGSGETGVDGGRTSR
jgi:hypothetical protein